MQVTGQSNQQLHEALVNAFDFNSLEAMLEFALQQRLDLLAGRSDEFSTTVFRVIKEYNRRDQIEKLVQAARRFNPTHSQLHQVAQALQRATQVTAHLGDSVTPVGAWELEKLVRRQVPKLKAQEMRRQMMRVEGQMCVIERRIAGYGQALGSGFLVGPDVVLTNYHVVENYLQANQAQNLQVRFDALLQEEGVRQPEEGVVVAVEEIPIARPYTPGDGTNVQKSPAPDELDFALLLLAEEAGRAQVGGAAGQGQNQVVRGWLKLPDPAPVLEVGDPLIIYQYPGGRELMMAIDTEAVVGAVWDGLRLRYRNNTEPGSSGSPVFNFAWDLVALHHAGARGPEPAAYNQGIPAAWIRAHLQAQGMLSLLGE
jgi:V8-like Glu-specific endopeptidase